MDLLRDYQGVEGLVSPYNELGVLKLRESFGGIIFALLTKTQPADKASLKRFLLATYDGTLEEIGDELHRQRRVQMIGQVGPAYRTIVEEALLDLPDRFDSLGLADALPILRSAFERWLMGCINQLPPAHFGASYGATVPLAVGMKNDPPGSMPLLAALYPPGTRMSAIIRDPRDTNYDFNNYYQLGFTPDAVRHHTKIYLGQIKAAMAAVRSHRAYFEDRYRIVEFEKLVTDADYRGRYVHHMVGNRLKVTQTFDAKKSAENMGLYRQYSKALLDIVEEQCMAPYEEFLKMMEQEGLLLP